MKPTIPAIGLGLVGGFAAARWTSNRILGGAVWAGAGAVAAQSWWRDRGPIPAAVLTATYAAAMGGSHPLAKKIGAWPSVLAVTAATVAADVAIGRRAGG